MSFSFSTPSPVPGAPGAPAGGFSFGQTTPAPSLATNVPPSAQPPTVDVPDYDSIFHGQTVWKTLRSLVLRVIDRNSDSRGLIGEELIHTVNELAPRLLTPTVDYTPPDMNLRQQLAARPTVKLYGQEANLTQSMLREVFALSDDLRISEKVALCLYAKASSDADRSELAATITERVIPVDDDHADLQRNVPLAARELYFYETSLKLKTLLFLFQSRLDETGQDIVVATDLLLQKCVMTNLIQLVREYSKRLESMVQDQSVDKHSVNFVQVHADFCMSERQVASQTLFFIAYHAQLTGQEVASLIDLVHDLSNGLDVLDPYEDIPSPFETHVAQTQDWMVDTFPSSLPPLKEKDAFTWTDEVVEFAWKSGKAQLLRSVSILSMAVVCALEADTLLIDRNTHEPNTFGKGNALLPPQSTSSQHLDAIHSRLSKEAVEQWQRPDILGLLMAAYSLLIHPAALSLPSPRGNSAVVTPGSIDLRKSWRECLEAPTELKSFTFARLCLVPSLQAASYGPGPSLCDTREFLCSALSVFASQYIDVLSGSGDLPISRAKWLQDAEEDLSLRRSHQEQQRQFQAWSGARGVDIESVPANVDLLDRPDCMDDVVAFVVAVCLLGPCYAICFWSREESDEGGNIVEYLVPSRALRELDRQQEEDPSLQPSYVSFLAALARAEDDTHFDNGGSAVHRMLCSDSEAGRKSHVTWSFVFEDLRWYARELNPQNFASATNSMKTSATTTSSTSYYYAYDATAAETQGYSTQQSTDGSGGVSRTLELGEENTLILSSHLALLMNVCDSCPSARTAVLNTNLPIVGSDGVEVIGQDSALTILFTLSLTPVSPDVRGSIFACIAKILDTNGTNDEQCHSIRDAARKAWDMLDECGILPIHMFDQYPVFIGDEQKNANGLSFPPSSTSLVAEKATKSWIPASLSYSIIFEMEYVESVGGSYPSTEGFLQLLRSLFLVAGSPSDVGRSRRSRSGCCPYIEYVVHLVLPRATGKFPQQEALPFRSQLDRSRLASRALEVVEVVLSKYTLFPCSRDTVVLEEKTERDAQCRLLNSAVDSFGQVSLAKAVVVEPIAEDAELFASDFSSKPSTKDAEVFANHGDAYTSQPFSPNQASLALAPSVPRPKSPGLTVLVNLLSSTKPTLLETIVTLLEKSSDVTEDGKEIDRWAMAFALFNSTPPTHVSAKISTKSRNSKQKQTLLKSLLLHGEPNSFGAAIYWRERTLLLSLNILCAAIAREEVLRTSLDSLPGQMKIVPVLRFNQRSRGLTRFEVLDTDTTKMARLLVAANPETRVLCDLTKLVGYRASSERVDAEIARAATAVILYMDGNLGQGQSISQLHATIAEGEKSVAVAFGNRFALAARRIDSPCDRELVGVILRRMLSDLRVGPLPSTSIARTMLGLHGVTGTQRDNRIGAIVDCFSALENVLQDVSFIFSPATSSLAADGFEVLYRLVNLTESSDLAQVIHIAERLRSIDFWKGRIKMLSDFAFCRDFSFAGNESVLHATAWLLKSVVNELQLLGASEYAAPQPVQFNELLSFLYLSPFGVTRIIEGMPIERPQLSNSVFAPREETVRETIVQLKGAPEVVRGYSIIDQDKLSEYLERHRKSEDTSWASEWNQSNKQDCATAHLSSAIHLVLGSSLMVQASGLIQLPRTRADGNKLLMALLERLSAGSQGSIDDVFFTTATRNLALCVLVAARIVLEESAVEPRGGKAERRVARAMLARTVVTSGFGNRFGSPDGARKDERTAILASALSLFLQKESDGDLEIREGALDDFLAVAKGLSRLSLRVSDTVSPVSPSDGALIARSCLVKVLELLSDTAPASNNSAMIMSVLLETDGYGRGTTTVARSMVILLEKLDWNVADLLSKIALLPSVGEVLLDDSTGVLKALKAASARYKLEESRHIQAHNASNFDQAEIVVPQFLPGHVHLMKVLLSIDVGNERRVEVAAHVLDILGDYDLVLKNVLRRFPIDDDFLLSVASCYSQVRTILGVSSRMAMANAVGFSLKNDEFERGLVFLSLKISQSPLPPRFLSSSAIFSTKSALPYKSSAVAVSCSEERSWWEPMLKKVGSVASPRQPRVRVFPREIIECSLLGVNIALTGLSIYAKHASESNPETQTLAHALSSCTEAVRLVSATRHPLSSNSGMDHSEDEMTERLVNRLSDLVTQIVLILLARVKNLKGDDRPRDDPRLIEFCRTIRLALDHCRLDQQGTKAVSDENSRDYSSEIAKILRREIQI